jgi:uncharacterized GH25 family protein
VREKISKIVQGHEIWLEYKMRHLNSSDPFECRLLYGHNLKQDGVAEAEKIKAVVFTGDDDMQSLPVEATADDLRIRFVRDPTVPQVIVSEYDYGVITVNDDGWHRGPKKDFANVKRSGYYYQYAKTIVPGYGIENPSRIIGQELEIVAIGKDHYHVDDAITLRVLYDGEVLAGGTLTVAASDNDGQGIETLLSEDGTAVVALDRPGNWIFKVRHADPAKGVDDQYDEKVITSVLTVMDVH